MYIPIFNRGVVYVTNKLSPIDYYNLCVTCIKQVMSENPKILVTSPSDKVIKQVKFAEPKSDFKEPKKSCFDKLADCIDSCVNKLIDFKNWVKDKIFPKDEKEHDDEIDNYKTKSYNKHKKTYCEERREKNIQAVLFIILFILLLILCPILIPITILFLLILGIVRLIKWLKD